MDEPHSKSTDRPIACAVIGVMLLTLAYAAPLWGASQLQQRFSGILLLESRCSGSLPAMAWALETLNLSYTVVTTWADLEGELSSGAVYGLVMINAYDDVPTAASLTALDDYLVGVEGAFVIFAQYSIPAGLRSEPL